MKRNSTTAFPRTYAIKSVTTVILFDMIDLDGATETIWPRLLVFIWRTFFFLSSSTCVYYDFHFEIKENDNNKIWFSILWSVNMADILHMFNRIPTLFQHMMMVFMVDNQFLFLSIRVVQAFYMWIYENHKNHLKDIKSNIINGK